MWTGSARRWWALAALVLALLTLSLDLSVLNVALPTLAADLRTSTTTMQWIIDAYTLVMAALLLPAGLLGDRLGRKRLLLTGLVLFGIASLGAAYVTTGGQLIAARALMGVGAAILTPLSLSILPTIFPPEERPKAIAVWAAASAAGMPLGPILGGYLLQHFWWGSVFLINVPVVAIALAACVALLPESRERSAPSLDVLGVILSTGGLIALVYGIIQAPVKGWADPAVIGSILGGAALLAVFLVWEARISHPLIELRLFHDGRFLLGSVSATLITFAVFGAIFVLPLYFQGVMGNDALGTGLRLLPLMIAIAVGAKAGERLASRIGARATITCAMLVVSAALGAGALTSAEDSYAFVAGWLAALGLGMGLGLPASMNAAMSALNQQRTGVGTALMMTLRMVGGALGVAVLGTVLNTVYRGDLNVGGLPARAASAARDSVLGAVQVARRLDDPALAVSARHAFASAMDWMLAVCAVTSLAGAVITAAFLRAREPERTSEAQGDEQSVHDYVAP